MNLKYLNESEMENLIYVIDHTPYHMFKIKYIIKKHKAVTDNLPVNIFKDYMKIKQKIGLHVK